ncbi:hypothetical protein [Novosphingobium sp.]|uniref:hypothetical protein n=1 Tax=Novosphingobium sp. TaxID=1874826 RepID=UPI00286A8EDE|nr:hypothetical protein [Novosphingobium sp.]
MTDEQFERLVNAVQVHGDQLGGNLVHLKRFLERLKQDEQSFLAEQRAASDRAQDKAHRTAIFSAIAAAAAAIAAIFQAYTAIQSHNVHESNSKIEIGLPPPP